jgi:hypothetical protein
MGQSSLTRVAGYDQEVFEKIKLYATIGVVLQVTEPIKVMTHSL